MGTSSSTNTLTIANIAEPQESPSKRSCALLTLDGNTLSSVLGSRSAPGRFPSRVSAWDCTVGAIAR